MIDPLIKRLEDEQRDFALEALTKPSGRDAFEYGRVAGVCEGIERARRIVEDILMDRERKTYNL